MAKNKEHTRYNVLSMRISDKEMAALAEMKQHTCKSTSTLLREAMQLYGASREFLPKRN
jgi:hypothetical protein